MVVLQLKLNQVTLTTKTTVMQHLLNQQLLSRSKLSPRLQCKTF